MDPLFRAFNILVRTAEPALASRALRAALAVLVADAHIIPEQPRPPQVNGGAPAADASATSWNVLRPRLHAIVSACNSSERYAIAAELGITSSTLRNIISTTVPGGAVVARVARWLEARDGDDASEPAEGHSNGVDSAHRLPSELREKLAFMIATDPAAVRRDGGVGIDVAHEASTGAEFAPEIIRRLTRFLAS